MKVNQRTTDRAVRTLFAVILFIVAFTVASGIWTPISFVLGAVMVGTAAIGFCPLYALLGINTCATHNL